MKGIYYLIATALLTATACTSQLEEQIEGPGNTPEISLKPGEMAFRIVSECGQSELEESRSSIKDSTDILWEAGDTIAIWDGVDIRPFVAKTSGANVVFTGTAVEASEYWALYPWTKNLTVNTTNPESPVFNTTLPLTQSLRDANFARGAAISIGKGTKDGIQMKNVCGFLRFTFPNAAITALEPGSLNHITVTSLAGKKLGGSIGVTLTDGLPSVSGATAAGDDVLSLSFATRPLASTSYYIAALPADLGTADGGIRLDFARSNDCATATISGGADKANVLQRSRILDLGKLWIKWRAAEEESDDSSANPSGTVSYFRLSKLSHPYILASDEDFRKLRELLDSGTYPLLTTKHNHTITQADSYCGKHIPTIDELVVGEDDSFQGVFNSTLARGTIGHLVCCSYAYRTTGEQKYLDECKTVIAQRLADEYWWKSGVAYLSPAEITMGMAIAYDWLYYDLTLEERTAIRNAIMNKPFTYGTTRNESKVESQMTNEKNNRGQVHNAGILATALAVYDKDKTFSKTWIEKSIPAIRNIVDFVYGTSGSTQEGYGYWDYGATYQAWWNEMMRTAFGTDCGIEEKEGFIRTPDYYLYMSDHISPFAFSDGGRSSISSSQALWWMAATRNNSSLLITEKYLFDKGDRGEHRVMPIIPIALSKNTPIDLNGLSRPSSDVWSDNDDAVSPVVLARTGWTNTDSDKYLGLKGGYAAVSHGHMDAGTFEYHACGKRWSMDSGVGGYAHYTNAGISGTGQTTSEPGKYVRWIALATNSLGHSTLSFANYDQSIGGIAKTHNTDHIVASTAKATILETYNTAAEKGGKLNMSPAFKGQVQSATRKAVIANGDSLVVEDCITALSSQDAQMIWRMVTPASAKIIGNCIHLSLGGKLMRLRPVVSNGLTPTLRLWGSYDDAHPGKTEEFGWTSADYIVDEKHMKGNIVGFTLTIPAGTSATITTSLAEVPDDYNDPDYSVTLDFTSKDAAFTTSLPTTKTSSTDTYITKTGGYNVTIQAVDEGGNTRVAGYSYGNNMLKIFPDKSYTSSRDPATLDGISIPTIPGKRLVSVKLTTGSSSFRAYVVNVDGNEVYEDTDPDVLNENDNWKAGVTPVFYTGNSTPSDSYRIVGRKANSFITISKLVFEYQTVTP